MGPSRFHPWTDSETEEEEEAEQRRTHILCQAALRARTVRLATQALSGSIRPMLCINGLAKDWQFFSVVNFVMWGVE